MPIPLDILYRAIRNYFICLIEEKIIGICSILFYNEDLAEIRTLLVDKDYRYLHIGEKLVFACIQEGKLYGVKNVFCLTLVPDFFRRIGFRDYAKEKLPLKIFKDCLSCSKYDNCDEEALILKIKDR